MILRAAAPEDAPAIAALEETLFGSDGWTLSSVLAEISGMDRFVVVASEREQVLGYAITMRSGDVVDLRRVGVHPSRRRRGVAHALLAAATDRAGAEGFERMLLEVGAQNVAALELYAGEGFVEIDRRERYYRDGDDAVVMCRPVGRAAHKGREWRGDG